MNKVVLMGRLTRNPDVRYSQGERATCVARYTLAVNRRFKRDGEPDADFINCVAFGRQGEFAEKYLKQGTKIVISGITNDQNLGNYVWERGKDAFFIWTERIGGYRSGSGDVFCAIIAADVVNGVPFAASVKKAAAFISEAVRESCSMELPLTDGLAIETCLWKLGTDFYDDYFEKREKR